ncbi:hypothetical protein ETAA1_11910 [Urbifossiella limnaea]|nr:hypothetical protein ETAA1_11910 [Urbifossiella limnaea]
MRSALAAVAAAVLLPAAAAAQNVDPKQHGWHTDYAAAKAEARRTGKPMMLVFRCNP